MDSFNQLIEEGIQKIVVANQEVRCESDPQWFLRYKDVRIGNPEVDESFHSAKTTTPMICRLRDMTYSAPIVVDLEYMRGNQIVLRNDLTIGKMPIMLRSNRCVLNNRSHAELIQLKECPYDTGGYFIINGTEKVILMHEQLSKNRILIEEGPTCYVTSDTEHTKARTNLKINKKGQIYLTCHAFIDEGIPIFVVFKAMGLENEAEILEMICGDMRNNPIKDFLMASIEDCHKRSVKSNKDALEYMSSKLKNRAGTFGGNPVGAKTGTAPETDASGMIYGKPPIEMVRIHLTKTILAHVPVVDFSYVMKRIYLAQMIKRLIMSINNPEFIDDRDFYGNKRIEMAGSMIALLFEDLFKRFNSELKMITDKTMSKPNRTQVFDVVKHIRPDIITNGLVSHISTGNWNIKRFRMERVGVSQVLSRLSYISALGMMTRIQSQFEKTRKTSGPRSLQASQWGLICPADTPEGESCGLIKNLALMTHVTTDVDENSITRICISHATVQDVVLINDGIKINQDFLVFVNGLLIGIVMDPKMLVLILRTLRRKRKISEYVSVSINHLHKSVYIATDGGRLCRPYIIVNRSGRPKVTSEHLKMLTHKKMKFNDFIEKGLIEYLDVNEACDAYISLAIDDIKAGETTHLEIEPYTILGVCAGLIPYPHNNQSPRNTYQCAMGKQAMGSIGYNQRERIDTLMYLLAYPQRPIVQTKTIQLVHFDKLPAGQNAIVAVMSYSGYDIEDATVVNKASLDRGYGRCFVYRSQKCLQRKYPNLGNSSDIIMAPMVDGNKKLIFKHEVSLWFDAM